MMLMILASLNRNRIEANSLLTILREICQEWVTLLLSLISMFANNRLDDRRAAIDSAGLLPIRSDDNDFLCALRYCCRFELART